MRRDTVRLLLIRSLASALFVRPGAGCSDDGDEAEADDDAGSAGDVTGGEDCIFQRNECAMPFSCDPVQVAYVVPEVCESGVSDLGADQCALTALRDRVPGGLNIQFGGFDCLHNDDIAILGDGTAVVTRVRPQGTSDPSRDPPQRVSMRPAEFFQSCLDSADLAIRLDCLANWFEEGSCVPGACCPMPNDGDLPPC